MTDRRQHADVMRAQREKALKARLNVVARVAGYPTTMESRQAAREALEALGLDDVDRDFPDPDTLGSPTAFDAKPRRRQRSIIANRDAR